MVAGREKGWGESRRSREQKLKERGSGPVTNELVPIFGGLVLILSAYIKLEKQQKADMEQSSKVASQTATCGDVGTQFHYSIQLCVQQ